MLPRFALAFIVAWCAAASVHADDALLDQAVKRHAASLAEIRTLTANVSIEPALLEDAVVPDAARPKDGSRTLPGHRGEYFRSGLRVRVNEVESPLGKRTVIRDYGAQTGQMRQPGGGVGGKPHVITGAASAVFSHLDVSEGYLFALPAPAPGDESRGVTLARHVASARRATARHETLDGADTVRIDISSDSGGNGYQVWLDVGANYLFRRVVKAGPKGPQIDIWIREYAEPKPGVFCPVRADHVMPKLTRSLVTLTNVKLNEPVPDSLFSTDLPAGTRVVNHDEGKVYEVTASGKPDKVVGRVIEPQPVNASNPASGTAPTPLLADEPKTLSWSRVILAASVLLAVAGVVLRYRRRAAAT